MLTDKAIRALKPREKLYRVADTGGLCLEVNPTGSKLWRYRYRYLGRAKMVSLGSYPKVTLLAAREERDRARSQLREGRDPSAVRAAAKDSAKQALEASFPTVAKAWLDSKQPEWAPETHRKAKYVIETYLIPQLRREVMASLATPRVAEALATIAAQAPSLASKARQYVTGIVAFAVRRGLREDGRLLSLRGALPKHEKGHIPAATDLKEVAALARAIDIYPTPVTRGALKLAMLTAMRPGIVASARWNEIDLVAGEWHVPGTRMKTKHAHIVSLPRQAIDVLRQMLAYTDGKEFVFPPLARQGGAHLHRDALSRALRIMGFQGRHATHGFRGMLRTVARERLGIDSDVLEAQLAHAKKGDVQKAYDRTTFGESRRSAMQAWADYLDELREAEK